MGFKVMHVKDAKGRSRGTLFAQSPTFPGSQLYMVGWAMCNKKDVFAKKEGVGLARVRAEAYEAGRQPGVKGPKIPQFILTAMPAFLDKCDKYFKGNRRPAWCWTLED